jgi:hypothetical protein
MTLRQNGYGRNVVLFLSGLWAQCGYKCPRSEGGSELNLGGLPPPDPPRFGKVPPPKSPANAGGDGGRQPLPIPGGSGGREPHKMQLRSSFRPGARVATLMKATQNGALFQVTQ